MLQRSDLTEFASTGLMDICTPSEEARDIQAGLDQVMMEARRNSRVCPTPQAWQALHDAMIRISGSPGELPPAPLCGKAWKEASAVGKRLRLRDLAHWAAERGILDEFLVFVRAIPEDHWHHV